MSGNEYQGLSLRTMADQQTILDRLVALGPKAMQLDNAARGLADDCGEVCGAVKKWIEYGQPLDVVNLLEEVGDVLWRLAQVCDAAGFTLEDAMAGNVAKLRVRYPTVYTDAFAAESGRDRAAERQAVERQAVEQDGHGFGHVVHPKATPLGGKFCETCNQPATRAIHDSNREFTREETHYFCTRHDRPTAILKD